jgi:uncharacterized membrane protein YeaQ/YmgE (transglycosylase-associated protein family)
MTLLEFLILLLVALVCGAIAQSITGYSRGGCLASLFLGFIGAVVGVWLARLTQLPELFNLEIGGTRIPIVWTVIGAALFCGLLQFLGRRSA